MRVRALAESFVLVTKRPSAANQPLKAVVTRRFKGEHVRKAVHAELSAKQYRPDLESAVFARIAKLNRARAAKKAAAAAKKA